MGYAAAIGLDPKECRVALIERRFAPHVRELATAAARSGIIGTPIVFINGERFEDRVEAELLGPAVDRIAAG